MLSALRRSCLSVTFEPPPIVLAPLEMGPGWPTEPSIWASDRTSEAADSRAPNASLFIWGRALETAERRMGCASRWEEVVLLASAAKCTPGRLGDTDIVVALVVAVLGLSSDTLDIACPEVAGVFPVSSSL